VRGTVAGGLALNPSHLSLDTPANNLFSVVEGKWSPLCNEASNLWSVRDPCPFVEHMAPLSKWQILWASEVGVTVWKKMGLRLDLEILDTAQAYSNHLQGKWNQRA
jgi:hypothetical protein